MANAFQKYADKFCQGFAVAAGAIFCLAVTFFILAFFMGFDRLKNVKSSFFMTSSLDEKDFEKIRHLVESKKIISFDSIFTQTLSYYDTIITFLIGILGVAVAGAFIYIKGGSDEKNKEHAKKHINSFLETKRFNDIVENSISNKVNEWGEDATSGFEKIKQLERKVSSLEEDSKKDANKKIGE